MATLEETGLGRGNFIKTTELFDSRLVFTIVGASEGELPPELAKPDGDRRSVEFDIILDNDPDREVKTFSLGYNAIRARYITYFEDGKEEITGVILTKGKGKKGNPPWIFESVVPGQNPDEDEIPF